MKKAALVFVLAALAATLPAQPWNWLPNAGTIASFATAPSKLAIADMNGDGLDDLLVANGNTLYYLPGTGGGFGAAQVVATMLPSINVYATDDVDGDGDLDCILVGSNVNGVALAVNGGGGIFANPITVVTASNTSRVALLDVDDDGAIDIVRTGSAQGPEWHRNLGFGFFGAAQLFLPAPAGSVLGLQVADLDADGDQDFLVQTDQTIVAAWNQASGSFASTPVPIGPAHSVIDFVSSFATLDVDADGDLDVVAAGSNFVLGNWFVLGAFCVNTGGTFSVAQSFPIGIIASPTPGAGLQLASGDLDNDGDDDLLAINNPSSELRLLENDGSSFTPSTITNLNNPNSLLACDVDGDGLLDAVTADTGAGTIDWHRNEFILPITATATAYGTGCGSPAMTFVPTQNAIVGTSMGGTISNTPTPLCVVALGWSDSNMPGIGALPFDLSSIGMTGCDLLVSGDAFGLPTSPSGQAFVVNWNLQLATNWSLMGFRIYTQAYAYAPGANPLQVVASNGIDWLIGNQ